MLRQTLKKTDGHTIDDATLKLVIRKVLDDECSTRAAAVTLGVNRSALQRYVKKYLETAPEERKWLTFAPNYRKSIVLPPILEEKLMMYIMTARKLHYGLTRKQVRQLAYQVAIANNSYCPKTWHLNQCAGDNWCHGFMKRHSELSLSRPDGTSMVQSTTYIHKMVNTFYNNLESVYEELGANLSPSAIYNLDETTLSTVNNPTNFIAPKDEKQVSQITACCIIAADGNSIPPYLVFPLVHFKEDMLEGAPLGSSGGASSTGCMNYKLFIKVLEHFQKHVRASVEKKVLLILDNHESHITVKSLDFCKENGIILLTLPPDTLNKLQPIGHTVYKSLRSTFNAAGIKKLVTNVSKTISIYEVAELFRTAYTSAFTPENIKKGFESTGIWKLNRNVFKDDEFLCAPVPDRPVPGDTETASPEYTALPSNRAIGPSLDVIQLDHNYRKCITALKPVDNM